MPCLTSSWHAAVYMLHDKTFFFSRAIEPLSVHCYVYIHNKCHVLQKQADEKQKKNFRARFHVPRNWQENITFI